MDDNQIKLVPLGGYPSELREKAIAMHVNGYSKTRVAELLGVGRTTIRRWLSCGINPYFKPHPPEVKQKAIEMMNSGETRTSIAKTLGISYSTISFWFRGIVLRERREYPRRLRRKVRALVKKGMLKSEIARLVHLPYQQVLILTSDIKSSSSKLSGSAERILSELMSKGYFIPNKGQITTCRILKHQMPINSIVSRSMRIYYVIGRENDVVKHLLENASFITEEKLLKLKAIFKDSAPSSKDISKRRLNIIKQTFFKNKKWREAYEKNK